MKLWQDKLEYGGLFSGLEAWFTKKSQEAFTGNKLNLNLWQYEIYTF